jgi:hypothetical protein
MMKRGMRREAAILWTRQEEDEEEEEMGLTDQHEFKEPSSRCSLNPLR